MKKLNRIKIAFKLHNNIDPFMKLVTMIELLSAVPNIKSENIKNAFIFNALRPDHILI